MVMPLEAEFGQFFGDICNMIDCFPLNETFLASVLHCIAAQHLRDLKGAEYESRNLRWCSV
jgi:hypothetical protein